ncbi:MAG: ABC transporter ATP-binding protein [Filifactoraceae bacterium]
MFNPEAKVLIEAKDLMKYFDVSTGFVNKKKIYVQAVDKVSFAIRKGETLGLVGESGCGKSTTGRTLIKLYEPTGGQILYDGKDITKLKRNDILEFRKKMQMIFQDPYASLNARMTVGDIIAEPFEIHKLCSSKSEIKERVENLLDAVGLNPDHAARYPHEFSGGQRQRIGIARALAVEPEFIICDEPISALDVSIQAQVVNMLEDLQNQRGLTYLFIAHDLSMVKHISDRIGVMYLGKMVELTTSDELYAKPSHPYTKALLSAIPVPDPKIAKSNKRVILKGDVPSPINPPSGCRFRTRCSAVMDKCAIEEPVFKEIAPNHFCACHLY